MKKAPVCLSLLALLVPMPARAEWIEVAESTNHSTWWMDGSRVKLLNGKVHAWVKIDSSHDRTVKWSESKQLVSFDCSAEKSRTLSVIRYDSYGKVVSSDTYPDYGYGVGYDPVVPDTVLETVEKLACGLAEQGSQ